MYPRLARTLTCLVAMAAAAITSAQDNLLTIRGHLGEPIEIIEPDGTRYQPNDTEAAPVMYVRKGPTIAVVEQPEEPVAPEIVVESIDEEVDLNSAESQELLHAATQDQLNTVAVPQLPNRRGRAKIEFALTEKEIEALESAQANLVTISRPVLPEYRDYELGPRIVTASVPAPTDRDLEIRQAAMQTSVEFESRVVPGLPQSAQKRIARTASIAVPRNGLSGSELKPELPLHLMQQPAPQLPPSAQQRAARFQMR